MAGLDKVHNVAAQARQLGWDVEDKGYNREGEYTLLLWGGLDDGEHVHIEVVFRASTTRTRAYLFHRGLAVWPHHHVRTPIPSLRRLWVLAQAYAPKKED